MNKDLKLTELEQDTQIEANRVNINEQIVLTNTNTTDIAEIKEYLDYAGGEGRPATTGDIENLQGQIDTNDTELADHETRITTLETNDAAQDGRLTTLETGLAENTAIDTQQDARLSVIEGALATSTSDYAIFSWNGDLDSTGATGSVIGTVEKAFRDDNLATYDETTGEVTVNKNSTVVNNYFFSATQLTGNVVTLTVQLYNVTKSTVVDGANIVLDFSGSIEVTSGARLNKGDVEAGDVLIVRAFTDGTNVVTITNAVMDYEVAAIQGQIDEVFDYNVVSTSSMGNASTLLDINQLATEMDAAEARLDATEAATTSNTTAITGLDTRLTANETKDVEQDGRLDALEGDTTDATQDGRLDALEQSILDLQTALTTETNNRIADQLPVSSVVLAPSAPTYGTWTDLGVLAAGQTIAGTNDTEAVDGTVYSGQVKSHNHQWMRDGGSTGVGAGGSNHYPMSKIYSYNEAGEETSSGTASDGGDIRADFWTKKVGGSYNKAYSLGIGTDIHVWKRTA